MRPVWHCCAGEGSVGSVFLWWLASLSCVRRTKLNDWCHRRWNSFRKGLVALGLWIGIKLLTFVMSGIHAP